MFKQLTPTCSIDSIYQPWLKELKEYLVDTYPLAAPLQPVPEDQPLPPRYTLSLCLPRAASKNGTLRNLAETKAQQAFPPPVLLPHPGGITAVVVSNTRVTPNDHWQDVRLVELDVNFPKIQGSIHKPLPGDRVVLYPKNYPEDVQKLLDLMEWDSVADREIKLGTKHPNGLYPKHNCTLRDLLTHNMDITAVPSRSFLHKLAFYTAHADQKEKLLELVQPDSSQEFYDFTSRPRRTILEVLAEFYSARIPYEAVPDLFPVIRGREFSIANGGIHWESKPTKFDADEATKESDPGAVFRFDLLAALVEYRTIIRKPRQGLCSRYLKSLPAGTLLHVTVKRETPPPHGRAAAGRPLIAIATGTGVAPVRSLIHDRSQYASPAEMLLFFGCRNKSADFHFYKEWPDIQNLTVIPAFSRDPQEPETEYEPEPEPKPQSKPEPEQAAAPGDAKDAPLIAGTNGVTPKDGDKGKTADAYPLEGTTQPPTVVTYKYDEGKSYVQHKIRQHSAKICELLINNAIICLCGNSGRMPTSVREALCEVAVAGGFCSDTKEAEKRLLDEKDPNRIVYWEETW